MKLAIQHLPAGDPASRAAAPPGLLEIRLGDDVLVAADPAAWSEVRARGASAAATRELDRELPPENLHLVVQLGNLFQRAHPDVPVLLDKGRYLVVDLLPAQARAIAGEAENCYAVRPLADSEVVFDVRPAAARRAAPQASILALTGHLTRAGLEEDLRHLVAFETRFSTDPRFGEAAEWARGRLAAMGYLTRAEEVAVRGGRSLNVIGEQRGEGAEPRGVVVVTAHLDSINELEGAAAPAPGADDNGSGSAGLLAIAGALAGHRAAHDLRLVLFGGEEEGLFGSLQHVAALPAEERSRIRAVVNMDMVATRNTEAPTVLIEGGAGVSEAVIDALAEAAETYTSLGVQTSLNPFNSDHVPFIDAGVPAVLTIEGADRANQNVHTREDTLEHIDFDLFLQILTMNVGFLAAALGEIDGP